MLVMVALASAQEAPAAERAGGNFGLGVAMGAPTGLAGRIQFGPDAAMQFAAGGHLGQRGSAAASVDYVALLRPIPAQDGYSVLVHAGGGLSTRVEATGELGAWMGVRGVAGLDLVVVDLPVDFFIEVAPTVLIALPDPGIPTWSMDGQIGARYYF